MGSGTASTGPPLHVPIPGTRRLLALAVLTGVAGGALVLIAFGLSRLDGELLRAGFFILGLFTIPVTIGAVIAAASAGRGRAPRMPRVLRSPARARVRCGLCRRPRERVGQLWICPLCDRSALDN